jgi:hypothetical protein
MLPVTWRAAPQKVNFIYAEAPLFPLVARRAVAPGKAAGDSFLPKIKKTTVAKVPKFGNTPRPVPAFAAFS